MVSKRAIMILGVLAVSFLAACGAPDPVETAGQTTADAEIQRNPPAGDWRQLSFTDVMTNETFTLSDLEEPVLVESFAVWCPTCTSQQLELEDVGANVVSVNIDPDEDAQQVRDHVRRYGFTGRYVVASEQQVQRLIEEFGVGIVNAPSAPVVLLCPDGSYELLDRGLKRADELQQAIDSCPV